MDQVKEVERILRLSTLVSTALDKAYQIGLPNWYLGGGPIAQTVWNHMHGFELERGIKDIDLIYFDPDVSYEKEDEYIQKGRSVFGESAMPVEIRNQARVHLWYKEHFGYDIKPYTSSESAIDSWPTTATCIGATQGEAHGHLRFYAPFGYDDILSLTVRPNKRQVTEEIYLDKVTRWTHIWPQLRVIPWYSYRT